MGYLLYVSGKVSIAAGDKQNNYLAGNETGRAMNAGKLLADWRRARRLSQLELATRAGVSSRHISFVETGRSRAGSGLLRRLAEELDLGCRDTNQLLVAAGHAPIYGETRLDEPSMAPVRQALDTMLNSHLPFPATVLDAHWNLLMANTAMQTIMASMIAERGPMPDSHNMVELTFHPDGFKPFIRNWETVAGFLLRHIRRDLALRPDPGLRDVLTRLGELADVETLLRNTPDTTEPMLTLQLEINGTHLTTFSTLASFGTALDVVMEELRIEHYFPADDATRRYFL
jgi:transcriptional regulator with XRE-family HTH domain